MSAFCCIRASLLEKCLLCQYCIIMKKLELKNVLWKEGKYYVAQCLNVDVSSFGKTKAEAAKNLKEALDLYFEDVNLSEVRKIDRPVIVEHKLQYA